MIDYEDRCKDDFDDFRKLDFSDQAGSWRYFAPEGCDLRVNDDDFADSNFPGRFTRTLLGTGTVEEAPDLDQVPNDDGEFSMDDEITSMEFFPNCTDFYGGIFGTSWDLDGDGFFETRGEAVSFSAGNLDGPAEVTVSVRSEDPAESMPGAPVTVPIEVDNVEPVIGPLTFLDPFGLVLDVDSSVALPDVEYSVEGTFIDAGVSDTQTAMLAWGDGIVEPSDAFEVFYDAQGGATGSLRQSHAYTEAGTYLIQLDVVDDDDGRATAELSIVVASLVDAVQEVVDEIDALLADEMNPEVIDALLAARDELDGNGTGSAANGVLDMLEKDNCTAALVKIEAAIGELGKAELAGETVLSHLKQLLVLMAESLVRDKYLEAVAALGTPNRGQARQLDAILTAITEGHARAVASDYSGAIERFQDAVRRAQNLA